MTVFQPQAHSHLHLHGSGPMHNLPPEAKLVGLVAFVVAVALTPRDAPAGFAVDAVVLAAVVAWAGIRPFVVMSRLTVIAPFVAFALALPFVGDGDTVDVLGIELSTDGLRAMGSIIAKATLGAAAAIVVASTTPVSALVVGLSRLRVPSLFVGIVAFMFRYLDLVTEDLGRMRRAMVARGHDPRWLWQARPIANSAGTLFVRTYERGERIHGAMLARGFSGEMPVLDQSRASPAEWLGALVPAIVAWAGLSAVVLS